MDLQPSKTEANRIIFTLLPQQLSPSLLPLAFTFLDGCH